MAAFNIELKIGDLPEVKALLREAQDLHVADRVRFAELEAANRTELEIYHGGMAPTPEHFAHLNLN